MVAFPLPADAALAEVASAMEAHGFAGEVWDAQWRLAYLSSEYRVLVSAGRHDVEVSGVGEHILSAQMMRAREGWPTGPTFESFVDGLREWAGFVVATTPGGREALREIADPRLHHVFNEATPAPPPSAFSVRVDASWPPTPSMSPPPHDPVSRPCARSARRRHKPPSEAASTAQPSRCDLVCIGAPRSTWGA